MQKIGDSTSTANDAGEFSEGNPAAGVDPTWLTAAWHNAVQRELIAVVLAGGLTLDPDIDDQLLKAIRNINQSESGTYAVDTGAANAYVFSLTPALASRQEGVPIRIKVKTENTGASTINDGLGAVPLVGGAHSALQRGEMRAGGFAWIVWNSTVGTGSYVLLFCTGAPEQVAPATQSQHSVNLGQNTGRLIGVQVFSASGTYTPAVGTTKVIVEVVGGGGAGGGAATTSSSASVGGGGGGGCYVKALITAVSASVAVTIGAGGSGVAGGVGGNGGASSFGSYIGAGGGLGGGTQSGSSFPLSVVGGAGTSTYSNVSASIISVGSGGSGDWGVVWTLGGNALGGRGGASGFGSGGNPTGAGVIGLTSLAKGSGGSGATNNNTSAAAQTGGIGQPGVVVVYEYGTAAAVA